MHLAPRPSARATSSTCDAQNSAKTSSVLSTTESAPGRLGASSSSASARRATGPSSSAARGGARRAADPPTA